MNTETRSNEEIASFLEKVADLLESIEDNPFRIRAYRNAAGTIRRADISIADAASQENREELMALPGIGEGLATLITDYVREGESELLRQLEQRINPQQILSQVPGVGETLSRRIIEDLNIHTLEDLELAAHDGRLQQVEGFGPERVKAVRTSLAGMLGESARRQARQRVAAAAPQETEPSVGILLDVDAEYRRRAEAGELQMIAPKRFNPEGTAWLPILHTTRDGWSFTCLFSNTARAHEAGKTSDWVVIYFERDGGEESQRTIVTETSGPLSGKRVVRGREAETRQFYLA